MSNPSFRPGLPLPVARLALRSRNAKSSKDRHDTAWYAWEVSIKLAVAAAPPADPSKLVRGTIGTWAGALRLPEAPLGGEAIQALWELVAREGELAKPKRDSLTPRALIDGLVAYRNRVLGHGALRDSSYYEAAAEVLLAALAPVWQAGVFLAKEAELLYCEAIVLGPDGWRLARLLELSGPLALVKDPRGSAVPESLLPRRLYLRSPAGWRDLHPWVLYTEGDAAEREALYCFNGLGHTLAEYLDYASGETLRNEGLEKEWPGIVAELRKLFPAATEAKEDTPRARDAHRLGDYTVLGKLGEGGMGVVYLARQEPLGRLVALKTLPGERAKDPVALARFRQEVAALARSEHPSVVKILSSGQTEGVWYYAMEYVEGADLERVARALSSSDDFGSAVTSAFGELRAERKELFGDLPDVPQAPVRERQGKGRYRDLARYFRDAARGLHHLHERGVLHRDVKPANLMVTAADQRAVVMDLGVAALEGGTLSISHDRSRIVGTLRYMAPEQLQRNLLSVDRRADVYSLGASLYELLCDRPFLEGDSEAQLIQQVLKEEPRPLDRHVPDDLARIVRKATDKDPARRYETAEGFADDLENFLAGRPITARDPEIGYLIRKWVERNRALATTIVASVVLILMVVAGFTLTLSRKSRDLAKANESLELKSTESEERRKEAQSNAERATEQARIARENEQRAVTSASIAEERERALEAMTESFMRSLLDSNGLIVHARDTWKAPSPDLAKMRPMDSILRLTVHHSAKESDGYMDSRTIGAVDSTATVLGGICRFHKEGRNWGDIGYHFAVDVAGRVFECRSIKYEGAHAGGDNNSGNVGIVLLGDYENLFPTPQQFVALLLLIRSLQQKYGVGSDDIAVHSDFAKTECPGSSVRGLVALIRDGIIPVSGSPLDHSGGSARLDANFQGLPAWGVASPEPPLPPLPAADVYEGLASDEVLDIRAFFIRDEVLFTEDSDDLSDRGMQNLRAVCDAFPAGEPQVWIAAHSPAEIGALGSPSRVLLPRVARAMSVLRYLVEEGYRDDLAIVSAYFGVTPGCSAASLSEFGVEIIVSRGGERVFPPYGTGSETIRLDLRFASDSLSPEPSSVDLLFDSVSCVLASGPSLTSLVVSGFADSKAPLETLRSWLPFDQPPGTRREMSFGYALHALDHLYQVVDEEGLACGVIAHGIYYPIAHSSTPEGQAKNRRVEWIVRR